MAKKVPLFLRYSKIPSNPAPDTSRSWVMRSTDSANPAAANIKIVICIYGINEQGLTCGEAKEIFLNLLHLNIIYYLIVTAEWSVINVRRQSFFKKTWIYNVNRFWMFQTCMICARVKQMSFIEYHNCLETVLTQNIKCDNLHVHTRSGDAGFPKI